jgi:hypothetical protein
MPNKTSKKKRVVALPKIPKELIDQMVSGPMDASLSEILCLRHQGADSPRIINS